MYCPHNSVGFAWFEKVVFGSPGYHLIYLHDAGYAFVYAIAAVLWLHEL